MFDNKESKTDLSELGEFGLIDHLTRYLTINQPSTKIGIGDDAAVLNFEGDQTVVTTDLLVEGVHFDLSFMPLKHLGYKAVMVNLSDVYAMNAEATQITVSIAASNRFPVEALEELYAGIQLAAEIYKVDVVGGDTTSSTSGLMISITALGKATPEKITTRSGAKPNDLLVVSGDLGAAYMGLQVLEREKQVFKANPNAQPDLDAYTYIVERQLKPEARKDIPELFNALEVQPTSMIDISDGLSSEVIHLCKNSKVGANIFEEKIPLDPTVISVCEEFNIDSTMVALSGGEDYELLFTIDQKDYDKIKGNPHLTVIGHMTEEKEGMHLITRANQKLPIQSRGWNSFDDAKDEE
ncbi:MULTISPECIES: thiamine-phosphate kinase [Mesonia]|uniref:Thiamine-monophosphate kinase n=1 Tax=Mesonia oceanica TaxID=2687242 RepID=A0AC61Y8E9_9FLAO|nr:MULTISPECIES: thiamine-phosphate kinase [Mesonia]MAN27613.1 thiamine-phosphate kinase [Mesonia sp.]MAQ40218.1 thiamine-phosphate kinase [Mesonia sp.]MBJ97129.1 thiamine-phosphate kinase [Flavobacteriaceae bacterium]VVV00645.1 Thiamine-monophosphate kinase [Mesonia oceanica]|tara:strand:- start:6544 stop:7602 length:1059 start_codon:yes stop_codon:yes gene_type:complete